ncbi:MAG: HNH endonuclease [Chloroflexota bacterium]
MNTDASVQSFVRVFSTLRQNANRNQHPTETLARAPNKPFLLLSTLELFTQGRIVDGKAPAGPEIGEIFSSFWDRIMPSYSRPNMALPFFHLKNDGGFWTLVAKPGQEEALSHEHSISTMSRLASLVAYAQLDPNLIRCLTGTRERTILRDVLIRQYFTPAAQAALLEQFKLQTDAYEYSTALLAAHMVAEAPAGEEYRPAVRDQGFRRAVVVAYDYRCAMCGIRVRTIDGHAIVEAAHIHAWSESKNDHPTNGLALCRLCHWSFDEGLLGADQERIILVSPQLSSQANVPGHLAQLARRPLIGPDDRGLAADPTALNWHRENIFRSA